MRTFEMMWQSYVHIERSHRVLLVSASFSDPNRMFDIFNTHLIYIYPAGVRAVLNINHDGPSGQENGQRDKQHHGGQVRAQDGIAQKRLETRYDACPQDSRH